MVIYSESGKRDIGYGRSWFHQWKLYLGLHENRVRGPSRGFGCVKMGGKGCMVVFPPFYDTGSSGKMLLLERLFALHVGPVDLPYASLPRSILNPPHAAGGC
jgi:hypothetical protein